MLPSLVDRWPAEANYLTANAKSRDTVSSEVALDDPLLIARLGSLPIQAVEELCDVELALRLERLLNVEKELSHARERVSKVLFNVIGETGSGERRAQLVALRRTLYNLRPLTPRQLEYVESISTSARKEILSYCTKVSDAAAAEKQVLSCYSAGCESARMSFRRGLADARFRNGLLISSTSLFGNLAKYVGRDGKQSSARMEQIERGLLRYFTRAAMKATPFGTFCSIVPVKLVAVTDVISKLGSPRLSGEISHQRSHVRLNKFLYGVLWARLRNRPAVRERLFVELNPTVKEAGQKWVFLTGQSETEAFQRLTRTAAIELIYSIAKTQSLRFAELREDLLATSGIDSTTSESTAFLNALIDVGFLRPRSPVSEQVADWADPLRALLADVDDEQAAIVVTLLDDLSRLVGRYGSASVDERPVLLALMRESVRSAMTTLRVHFKT
jgi:hypothetical protein